MSRNITNIIAVVFTVVVLVVGLVGGGYYFGLRNKNTTRYFATYVVEVPVTLPNGNRPIPSKPGKRDTIRIFDISYYDSLRNAIGDSVWSLALAEQYVTEFEDQKDGQIFYARTINRPMYRDAILDSIYFSPIRIRDSIPYYVPQPEVIDMTGWKRIKYFLYGAVAVYIYERVR